MIPQQPNIKCYHTQQLINNWCCNNNSSRASAETILDTITTCGFTTTAGSETNNMCYHTTGSETNNVQQQQVQIKPTICAITQQQQVRKPTICATMQQQQQVWKPTMCNHSTTGSDTNYVLTRINNRFGNQQYVLPCEIMTSTVLILQEVPYPYHIIPITTRIQLWMFVVLLIVTYVLRLFSRKLFITHIHS